MSEPEPMSPLRQDGLIALLAGSGIFFPGFLVSWLLNMAAGASATTKRDAYGYAAATQYDWVWMTALLAGAVVGLIVFAVRCHRRRIPDYPSDLW